MEPDENNSNIPGSFSAVATGHPLPKVVVTSFDPNADSSEQALQKIQQSLSEDSEELAEDSSELVSVEETLSVASSENEVADVDTSTWELTAEDCSKSSFRDSESSRSSSEIDVVEVKTNSSRKRKINPNVDDSYIELTRDGIGFAEVDALAKATLVGVLLTNYQHKIKQVEESLVKIRQQREQDAIALNLKKVKMKLLKKEMDILKQEISAKKRNVQELEKKEDLLCKEKVNLKEKATHYQTLKSQYEDNHEKGSLK